MRLLAIAALATLIAASPAAAQDRTGVRDCDDFIVWFAACMRAAPIPPEAMPIFQAALEQMRSGWRSMADNSDGRAALARSCRDYGNQMRQQLSGFGCRP
ncbi:MAG: hypothetical protein KF889_27155 [Alphaproteobacteria bacterium]|nr:hypothetical protein [Alphaproteobacteria bacterium]MCW5738671.1 hypothetical protein [Alphaproteobacteria bacterium]